ncbi:MAG: hypothetical protein MUP69_05035 [Candidatus Atribacteria bacterium]|nr:hypothetical protein [Candidatus Atribacteria bacterium]
MGLEWHIVNTIIDCGFATLIWAIAVLAIAFTTHQIQVWWFKGKAKTKTRIRG